MRKISILISCLIIVFLLIIYPCLTDFSGSYKTDINKLIKKRLSKKATKARVYKDLSSWKKARATHYNSLDPRQTRKNTNGKGSSCRMIKSGSIALGYFLTDNIIRNKIKVFVQIKAKNLNIITPYGRNIFLVDDSMNQRFSSIESEYNVDFNQNDLNSYFKTIGTFEVEIKIFRIS